MSYKRITEKSSMSHAKHAAMAPTKHAGTTDAKHHSHANGGLLKGLNR